jgi:phosphohistidine phosphatase
MKLLIVRHGLAGDKTKWKGPDSERPLTKEGRQKFKKAAKGLAELEDVDLVVTSPFLRALQTAELLSEEAGAPLRKLPELSPGRRPEEVLAPLAQLQESVVAVVGHEPGLGRLVSLLCAAGGLRLKMKKGGAALVDCGGRPRQAAATLLWLMTSDQLKDCA